MLVTIESTKVRENSGEKNGKPWRIREQPAFLRGERVAGEINLILEEGQAPYALGDYELDVERSVKIGRWGRLELYAKLAPVK